MSLLICQYGQDLHIYSHDSFNIMFTDKISRNLEMSHCIRKPTKCLGEKKGADQLRGNGEADQRLCFRYKDSTIPLVLKSEISSL